MTAPTINGTKFPQPVDELLPSARKLAADLDGIPSRNKLMQTYRIGAAKANELRDRLTAEREQQAESDRIHAQLVLSGGLLDRPILFPVDPDPTPVDAVDVPRDDPEAAPADTQAPPTATPHPEPPAEATAPEVSPEATTVSHPDTPTPTDTPARPRAAVVWPVVLLALPAFVAIWSGWVGLGGLTGFGVVHPLPGIWDSFSINSAITLPIGVETYGAYALYVWLSGRVPDRARAFAKWSALGSLAIGALGQVAYHLLVAAGITSAPWWITTAVACLPVAVLGMGAALAHLVREQH
ncbi:hypothetical protein AWW66_15315 [Micromonospora rosaria]|uniref:Uncharacterized protein n=1 Tax=Micromonospora rosaria TaxID=47874 RepID=A0A136PRX2_9ACTN|nr:hypothetical protein [Micromonospora rosaria]KXK61074.1 hypothetical protein AWW66_15315 [Micromonospora rosaria]